MTAAPEDAGAYLAELAEAAKRRAAAPASVTQYEDARIRDLPWVDYSAPAIVDLAMDWATDRWSRGPDSPMQFRPVQAVALLVASLCGGALYPIGTGWGKTLILSLVSSVLPNPSLRPPLLLIPPAMRESFESEKRLYNQSFKLPLNLKVMAYSQLSVASSTAWLEKNAPGALIADEAHNLRHLDAARTRRVERYMKAHPSTPCVFASGTFTSKSLQDYAHLAQWALKDQSPLPLLRAYTTLMAWCAVLDAKPTKMSGGDRFAGKATPGDYTHMRSLFPDWQSYDDTNDDEGNPSPRVTRARAIFKDRFTHAPGVVGTSTASVGANLWMVRRHIEVPAEVTEALEALEETWQRPDGEELVDAPAKWRCGRQLAQGFYYRWRWPNDEKDEKWLTTRAAWHRAVRDVVGRNRPHLDSPLLVGQQVHLARSGHESLVSDDIALLAAYEDWEPHSQKRWRGERTPPTETVWISDYLVKDAVAWFHAGKARFVWYEERAIEEALGAAGLPVFGRGTAPQEIRGAHGAAISLNCHKDGKNLQYGHTEMLYMSLPPSGTVLEQSLSRCHRAGQEADDVYAYCYLQSGPSENALASARATSLYQQDSTGLPYRILYAKWIDEKDLPTDKEK